ncbi:hypothetical protein B5M44_08270 [Shinella sumterensis]|uniref:hypothetical protein n=1 Tax=Shinella sumterensis TaxID=1967501 RepID=UPI00106EA01D|nr:hypothetical protein [Shinella sumterensis]MCD1262748.1 hypothetical protein [Shinella sumterensis]TFE98869.1 hypothetical protein B5M44_08270 [Shinella sumterensis]
MTDWRMPITKAALSLRRNALAGGALAVLILAIAPPTAGAHGFTAPLGWWLLLAFCLAPLALSAHLLFDAALFRLAASHDAEAAGLSAIDDVLERMGLRKRDGRPAPLAVRLAGCRRLIWMQRILLAVALALFAILLLDGLEGGGA